MRLGVLLLSAALLSGCFAAEAGVEVEATDGEATTATFPPQPAPAATGPPREPIEIRHDFNTPPESVAFQVAGGNYRTSIRFYAPESVMGCVSADAHVRLLTPEGSTFAEAQPGNVQTPCDGSAGGKQLQGPLAAGEWTVEFTGSGVAIAVLYLEPV